MKESIKIAIDLMGGENSPEKNLEGANIFLNAGESTAYFQRGGHITVDGGIGAGCGAAKQPTGRAGCLSRPPNHGDPCRRLTRTPPRRGATTGVPSLTGTSGG